MKQYGGNVKCQRFINAINNFKLKGFESYNNTRMLLLGMGNLIGEDDAMKERPCTATVSCFSTEGELFEISRENFLKIKQTDDDSYL